MWNLECNKRVFLNGKVTFRDSNINDVAHITENLAPECHVDLEDIINSGVDVLEFNQLVYSYAGIAKTLDYDDTPVMICGICQAYPDSVNTGFFFMLFTERIQDHSFIVARYAAEVLNYFINYSKYPLVISRVHEMNTKSLRWAELLGALTQKDNDSRYYKVTWKNGLQEQL